MTCWICGEDEVDGQHHEWHCAICCDLFHLTTAEPGWTCPDCTDTWDAREHHARALDRSDATHTLRVRHHQAPPLPAPRPDGGGLVSTDTGLAAIKLPADLERRGALEEYFAAVALSARRRELVAAAQASIGEADAEVARTHERCVELGLLPAVRRTTAKRTGDGAARASVGSVAQAVIDAVAAGATTPAEVAARIGGSNTRAAGALLNLTKAGRVHRVLDEDGFWRYSPIGGEQ